MLAEGRRASDGVVTMSPLSVGFVVAMSLKEAAQANAAAFRGALLRRDAAWFERTFAPGFTQKAGGSTLDRKAALAQLRGGLMRMDVASLSARLTGVKPEKGGYVATVAWTGTMRATLQGRPAKLTAKWNDAQRWASVKGRWSLDSIVTTGFERTID